MQEREGRAPQVPMGVNSMVLRRGNIRPFAGHSVKFMEQSCNASQVVNVSHSKPGLLTGLQFTPAALKQVAYTKLPIAQIATHQTPIITIDRLYRMTILQEREGDTTCFHMPAPVLFPGHCDRQSTMMLEWMIGIDLHFCKTSLVKL